MHLYKAPPLRALAIETSDMTNDITSPFNVAKTKDL